MILFGGVGCGLMWFPYLSWLLTVKGALSCRYDEDTVHIA